MYRVVLMALLGAVVMLMGARGCEEIEIPDLSALEDGEQPWGQKCNWDGDWDDDGDKGDWDDDCHKDDWDDDDCHKDDWDDDDCHKDDWDDDDCHKDDGDDECDHDWSDHGGCFGDGEPTCEDLGYEYFGPCGEMLGFGVAFGECERIEGCSGAEYALFKSRGECRKACLGAPVGGELCEETGGYWDPHSCGHYYCGEFPPCDAIIPGCDCGPEKNFIEGKGCVCDPACVRKPTCEDLGGIDFGACEMLMGYAVIDRACEAVSGCDPKGYAFFESLEQCRAACIVADSCDGNEDCHATKYCYFSPESQCGELGLGACVVMPELCPDVYDPVCGCDGQTYGNACDAGKQGVSVADSGECGQNS